MKNLILVALVFLGVQANAEIECVNGKKYTLTITEDSSGSAKMTYRTKNKVVEFDKCQKAGPFDNIMSGWLVTTYGCTGAEGAGRIEVYLGEGQDQIQANIFYKNDDTVACIKK